MGFRCRSRISDDKAPDFPRGWLASGRPGVVAEGCPAAAVQVRGLGAESEPYAPRGLAASPSGHGCLHGCQPPPALKPRRDACRNGQMKRAKRLLCAPAHDATPRPARRVPQGHLGHGAGPDRPETPLPRRVLVERNRGERAHSKRLLSRIPRNMKRKFKNLTIFQT